MVIIPPAERMKQAMAFGMPPFIIIEQPIKPPRKGKAKKKNVPSGMSAKGGSIDLFGHMNKESLQSLSKHINLARSPSTNTAKFKAVVPTNLEAEAVAFTRKLQVKVS